MIPLTIPEEVLLKLVTYYKPEKVQEAMTQPSQHLGGKSPYDFVQEGGSWEAVLAALDKQFSYAST
jgi:hypothetical protein